ncbi:MAG TPA: choice-of-anchor Q domain-containing protein [Burkholderiaceae bacterium]
MSFARSPRRALRRLMTVLRPTLFSTAACAATAALAAPAAVCTAPIAAVNTSAAVANVGTGTAASCTEAALRAAVLSASTIKFDCGAAPATIAITSQIDIPTDRNIVIDGGGKVTLDGGGRTRILSVDRENFRTSRIGLTLQHITLANGKAAGTRYVAPNAGNASCAYGWADGGGGAVYVRDSVLHAIDVTFRKNAAETPGPDVGGGAIYAVASLDVTVVGSTFDGNSGANGGAVGLLQSDGRFVNDLFQNNAASGTGANFVGGAAAGCPGVAQANQGGAGGNGGALAIDGGSDGAQLVCGSTFTANAAGEFGGALFRTPDGTPRQTTIDRTLMQTNRAKKGGALYVQNSKPLVITASTLAGNTAVSAGAADLIGDRLNVINSTFANNTATLGVGGALVVSGSDASGFIRNATFSGNQSTGGPGYFSAAIFGTLAFPVTNTVFANNLSKDAGSPMQCGFAAGSGSADMQWPQKRPVGGLADTACVSGIRFVDPQLGAIGSHGGPTPTVAPATTSPLRNAGTNCPATDQRGVARNTAHCTIGAVE